MNGISKLRDISSLSSKICGVMGPLAHGRDIDNDDETHQVVALRNLLCYMAEFMCVGPLAKGRYRLG